MSATIEDGHQEETLVFVCLRLGCVRRSPGSLAVPRRLHAEGDQEDERARPDHKERVRPDNEATCRGVARSAHGLLTRPPAAAWQVSTAARRRVARSARGDERSSFLEEEISFSCFLIRMTDAEEEKEISSSPKAIIFSHDLCLTKK